MVEASASEDEGRRAMKRKGKPREDLGSYMHPARGTRCVSELGTRGVLVRGEISAPEEIAQNIASSLTGQAPPRAATVHPRMFSSR